MDKYILSIFNQAKTKNDELFRVSNKGNFIKFIHELDNEYSADKRYKIHLLACSVMGNMNIYSAKVKYRGHDYYVTYDNNTDKYIEG